MANEETERVPSDRLAELSTLRRHTPILTVLAGQTAGLQFPLTKESTLIGRSPDCDLYLPDVGVSRRHARVTIGDQGVRLNDLGSTNGTHVSGQRITDRLLQDDDRIVMGPNAILLFHMSEASEGELHNRLYRNATRDALTGLYNESIFGDFLEAEWAYSLRHDQELSLLRVYIDGFAKLLDEQGQACADALLVGVVGTLHQVVRTEDLPARLGDSHFAVLLRRCDREQAMKLGERLRWAVDKIAYRVPESTCRVTVSVGVASRKQLETPTPAALQSAADDALRQATAAGGNRIVSA